MNRGLRVYFASKLHHAELLKNIRAEWVGQFKVTSRWIDHVGVTPDSSFLAPVFWEQDVEDIRCSDVVVVFGVGDEHLRGALVEAGVGLGLGRKVIVIGQCPDYGTWQYHRDVFRVPGWPEARMLLSVMRHPC
jgi:hypothetical protein